MTSYSLDSNVRCNNCNSGHEVKLDPFSLLHHCVVSPKMIAGCNQSDSSQDVNNVPCLDVEKCAEAGPINGPPSGGCSTHCGVSMTEQFLPSLYFVVLFKRTLLTFSSGRKVCTGLEPLGPTERGHAGLHQIDESCSRQVGADRSTDGGRPRGRQVVQ